MGIDVYTADLACHMRNVASDAAQRFGKEQHPLTAEGVAASVQGLNGQASPQGPLRAYLAARRVAASLTGGVSAGNPFSGLGPMFLLEVDGLGVEAWFALRRMLAAGSSVDVDDADDDYFQTHWDDLPGIEFARAVDRAQALVVPTADDVAYVSGGVAFVSCRQGHAFIEACVSRLGISRATLDAGHDSSLSEADNAALYNVSLFAFHLREAESARRPVGVWG